MTSLDAVIQDEAARAGIRFLGTVQTAFDPGVAPVESGMRICDTSRDLVAMNFLALNPVGGDLDPTGWIHNTLHPNERGHAQLARIVSAWIARPTVVGSPPTTPLPSQPKATEAAAHVTADPWHGGDSKWMLAQFRSSLRHRPGWSAVLFLGGAWLMWLELLRLARVARHVEPGRPPTWVNMHPVLAVFRSKSVLSRVVGLVLAISATVVISIALAHVVGLPKSYGAAQSATRPILVDLMEDKLKDFRSGANRDMLRYIPLYMALVIAVLLTISPARAEESKRLWHPHRRDTWTIANVAVWMNQTILTWCSVGFVILAGCADFVETWRFRSTLDQLKLAPNATIDRQIHVTRWWTQVKLGFLALAAMVLIVNVLCCNRAGAVEQEMPIDPDPALPVAV